MPSEKIENNFVLINLWMILKFFAAFLIFLPFWLLLHEFSPILQSSFAHDRQQFAHRLRVVVQQEQLWLQPAQLHIPFWLFLFPLKKLVVQMEVLKI